MLEELKKALLIDQKDHLTSLNEEKKRLIEERNQRDKAFITLMNRSGSVLNEPQCKEFNNNYSKISKFFNRKKYLREQKKLYDSVREDLVNESKKENEKANNIRKRLEEIDNEANSIVQILPIIDNAKDVSELSISFDYAKALLAKNDINIYDYIPREILSLGESEETTNNIEFMRKAISKDPFCILYDHTNDFQMYYDFINKLEYTKEDGAYTKEGVYNNKKAILDYLTKSKNGEIRIKPIYLIEAIKFYFKDVLINGDYSLNVGEVGDIYDALSRIHYIYDRSLKLSDEDYYSLERMYNPQENNYYCHQTSGNVTEERKQSILSNGLKVSHEWVTKCCIGANCRKLDCFLAIAGYRNFYGGHTSDGENYRILFEIPKGTLRPIGSDKDDGKETYILPDYVVAYMHDKTDKGELIDASLHINHNKRKTYRYLYKDNYNPEFPIAYENPDLLSIDKTK